MRSGSWHMYFPFGLLAFVSGCLSSPTPADEEVNVTPNVPTRTAFAQGVDLGWTKTVQDINLDGIDDLVVPNRATPTSDPGVYIIYGGSEQGLGGGYDRFVPTQAVTPQAIYAADAMGNDRSNAPDGAIDLFVLGPATSPDDNHVEVYQGSESNDFQFVDDLALKGVGAAWILGGAQLHTGSPPGIIMGGLDIVSFAQSPADFSPPGFSNVSLRDFDLGTQTPNLKGLFVQRQTGTERDDAIFAGDRDIYWCENQDGSFSCQTHSISQDTSQIEHTAYADVDDDTCPDLIAGIEGRVLAVILPCQRPTQTLEYAAYQPADGVIDFDKVWMDDLRLAFLDDNSAPELVILDAGSDHDSLVHIHWNLQLNAERNAIGASSGKDRFTLTGTPAPRAHFIAVGDFNGDDSPELWFFDKAGNNVCHSLQDGQIKSCP